MLLYTFYNANLIDIAKGKWELSTGFVDDCMFVAMADTLNESHAILKDMTECTNGGLDWSHAHNSPFEISKLAVMDFARTSHDLASAPLQICKTNPDSMVSMQAIETTKNYKYLGMVVDPKLTWRVHITKVVAMATQWSQQLQRVARLAGGLSPSKACQLYHMVAVPAFTYVLDIWYVPPFKLTYSNSS